MTRARAFSMSAAPRVVAHVDLDCFYCSCECQRDPSLKGRPLGVSQYNPFEEGGVTTLRPEDNRRVDDGNGSLIAVSYEARALGVKRGMRGHEARALAPDLLIVQVPTSHGKAELSIYREAGAKVLAILSRVADTTERASIDEGYLDLTKTSAAALKSRTWSDLVDTARGSHVGGVESLPEALLPRREVRNGHAAGDAPADAGALSAAWLDRPEEMWTEEERHLVAGAAVLAEARAQVLSTLGFTTSAGVAPNKLLAKLCSGLKKPASQTLLSPAATATLLENLPLSRLRGLGGALGERVSSQLGVSTAGELAAVPYHRLCSLLGEDTADRLHQLARGQSDDPVKEREVANSVQTSKTFRGPLALHALPDVHHWLGQLASELSERLADDHAHSRRHPRLLTVSVSPHTGQHFSRSCPILRLPPSAEAMADDAFALVRRWVSGAAGPWAITGLGLGASGFQDEVAGMRSITQFTTAQARPLAEQQTHKSEDDASRPQQQSPAGGLRKFFAPAALGQADDAQAEASRVRCERCGKELNAGEEQEHADWHFATSLARQQERPVEETKKRKAVTGPLDTMFRRT